MPFGSARPSMPVFAVTLPGADPEPCAGPGRDGAPRRTAA